MEQVTGKKTFFNVFPTLKVEEDIQILFADVEVQKITTNSGRDFLRIHIFSRHLIQKKQIRLMEPGSRVRGYLWYITDNRLEEVQA